MAARFVPGRCLSAVGGAVGFVTGGQTNGSVRVHRLERRDCSIPAITQLLKGHDGTPWLVTAQKTGLGDTFDAVWVTGGGLTFDDAISLGLYAPDKEEDIERPLAASSP